MKERPILFSAPMVRALLAGTKTQTRRKVKPDQGGFTGCGNANMGGPGGGSWWDFYTVGLPHLNRVRCPYGVPGDLLWVRETCRAEELRDTSEDGVRYLADSAWRRIENTAEAADRWVHLNHYGNTARRHRRGAQVPSIHMPRWASRISLRITDVRVERLVEIGVADAIAEGLVRRGPPLNAWAASEEPTWPCFTDPARAYAGLWNHINGAGSWDANPWVWAVSFEVVT